MDSLSFLSQHLEKKTEIFEGLKVDRDIRGKNFPYTTPCWNVGITVKKCSFHKIQNPSLDGHLFDSPKCLFTAMYILESSYDLTVLRGLIRFTGWGMATFVTSFNAECSVLKGHELLFPSFQSSVDSSSGNSVLGNLWGCIRFQSLLHLMLRQTDFGTGSTKLRSNGSPRPLGLSPAAKPGEMPMSKAPPQHLPKKRRVGAARNEEKTSRKCKNLKKIRPGTPVQRCVFSNASHWPPSTNINKPRISKLPNMSFVSMYLGARAFEHLQKLEQTTSKIEKKHHENRLRRRWKKTSQNLWDACPNW